MPFIVLNQYRSIVPPLRMLLVMWVLFAVQFYLQFDLGFLGVYPRHLSGLLGVVTAPLVHGSLQHILSNSLPLLFLGTAIFVFYNRIAIWVFFNCYLITGLLVWIFGRPFYHIGASGLVYGLAFFLIFLGLFRKDMKSILIAIVVVSLYGGMIYGLMPSNPNVSWESHAFGALVGIALSFVYRSSKRLG